MFWNFGRNRAAHAGFRVRSPDRNAETDRARVDILRQTLDRVATEAELERAGLAERLRVATDQASTLVGTDTFEYLDRDEASEEALITAESQMKHARARLADLETFRKKIDAIRDSVDELRNDLAGGQGSAKAGVQVD